MRTPQMLGNRWADLSVLTACSSIGTGKPLHKGEDVVRFLNFWSFFFFMQVQRFWKVGEFYGSWTHGIAPDDGQALLQPNWTASNSFFLRRRWISFVDLPSQAFLSCRSILRSLQSRAPQSYVWSYLWISVLQRAGRFRVCISYTPDRITAAQSCILCMCLVA